MSVESNRVSDGKEVLAEIPIALIYVPDGRKMRFDHKYDENRRLIDSMERTGSRTRSAFAPRERSSSWSSVVAGSGRPSTSSGISSRRSWDTGPRTSSSSSP